MTQVSVDVDFGPYHQEVIRLLNAMSGLAPESLGKLAVQYELHVSKEICEALDRVRQAASGKPWSPVKLTLNNLMTVYLNHSDRSPNCVNREILDLAQGAAYLTALALMTQDVVSREDFMRLTRPCREANIPEIPRELLTYFTKYPSLVTA